ncbi:MAG: hypothetical protein GF344_16170, partial [Chitinivibrionales bacterium]|nr:hypothetical protein [Chitinivibrionales bacterium]
MLTNYLHTESLSSSVWQDCLGDIEDKVGSERFETLFRSTDLSLSPQGHPCIQVPNRFLADFIEEHYSSLIAETLKHHDISPVGLRFVPTQRDWKVVEPIVKTIAQTRAQEVPQKVERREPFHTSYTFDRFVVGDSNR